jgi:hypothetical protein
LPDCDAACLCILVASIARGDSGHNGGEWNGGGWRSNGWTDSTWSSGNWEWVDPAQAGLTGKGDPNTGKGTTKGTSKGSGKEKGSNKGEPNTGKGTTKGSGKPSTELPILRLRGKGDAQPGGTGPSSSRPPEPREEGPGGDQQEAKYMCFECRKPVMRKDFMILEEDVAYDWEGSLYGMCRSCHFPMWLESEPGMKKEPEHRAKFLWEKLSKQKHNARADVKKRDARRVRCSRFEQLCDEVIMDGGVTWKEARKTVLRWLKDTTQEIVNCVATDRLKAIIQSYVQVKEREAAEPDYIPERGAVVGLTGGDKRYALQLLDRVTEDTSRYFICRQKACMYFSKNTAWVTTAPHGWQWMCPVCGTAYKAKAKNEYTHEAHFVFFKRTTQELLLSAWPATAEEDVIGSIMEALEPELTQEIAALDHEALQLALTRMANKYAQPVIFKEYEMQENIKKWIASENAKRLRQAPWTYDHLLPKFMGTQMVWKADLPIMSITDTKRFVAMVKAVLERTAGL